VASVPDQPPEATQVVAFVELHVSMDDPPLAIAVGLAVKVTVGAGVLPATVTATVVFAVPPAPGQLRP
jgi:hypothetical protein